MKAKLSTTRKAKYVSSHRKENPCHLYTYQVVTFEKADPYQCAPIIAASPIDLRTYTNKDGAVTACLWVNYRTHDEHGNVTRTHVQGSAAVAGCNTTGGFDKRAAAVDGAILNAGFDLDCEVAGTENIQEALSAIARAIGLIEFAIVQSHA